MTIWSERGRTKNTQSAHELYATLVGEIGRPRIEALYELKRWEIVCITAGYRRREVERLRGVRWQTWALLCGLGAKNLQSPDDLFELPGDGEDGGQVEISDEEYNDCLQMIREENERIEAERAKGESGEGSPTLAR